MNEPAEGHRDPSICGDPIHNSEPLDSLHDLGFPKVIAAIIGRYFGPVNINQSAQHIAVSYSQRGFVKIICAATVGNDIVYLLEYSCDSRGSHVLLRYDTNNKTFLEHAPIQFHRPPEVDCPISETHYIPTHDQLLIFRYGSKYLAKERKRYYKEAYIWDVSSGTIIRRFDLSLNDNKKIAHDSTVLFVESNTHVALAVSCDGSTIYSVFTTRSVARTVDDNSVIIECISSQTGVVTHIHTLMVPHTIGRDTYFKLIEEDGMLWLFVDQMLFRYDASLSDAPLQRFDLQINSLNATICFGKVFIPTDTLVVLDIAESAGNNRVTVPIHHNTTVVTKHLTRRSGNLRAYSQGLCTVEDGPKGWRIILIG